MKQTYDRLASYLTPEQTGKFLLLMNKVSNLLEYKLIFFVLVQIQARVEHVLTMGHQENKQISIFIFPL
jgi:hypothetical protein